MIDQKLFRVWIDSFFKPKETFALEKAKATISKGILNYAIAGLISGIFTFFLLAVVQSLMPSIEPTPFGIVEIIFNIIWAPVFSLFGIGVLFVVAKVLDGKGNFTGLYYLASTFAVATAFLTWIPIVGLLVLVYTLYLQYLVLREQQELSSARAIATILIPLIIVAILAAIFMLLFGPDILAAMGSQSVPTGLL